MAYLRSRCRTSNLWLLQLSGDFHPAFELNPVADIREHHMMRAMLTVALWGRDARLCCCRCGVAFACICSCAYACIYAYMCEANLAVDQKFANGTQGRIMMWHPASVDSNRAFPSSHPELLARFLKESSLSKTDLYPDIDHIDLQARQESLKVCIV